MGERPWLGGDGGSDWGLLRVYAVPSGGGAVDEGCRAPKDQCCVCTDAESTVG